MKTEEFKPYPIDTRIKVGNFGTIIGVKGKPIKGIMSHGYRHIGIAGMILQKVARMVAICHVHNPDPRKYNVVNHINAIKTDDRAENLEWCTQSMNMIHANKMDLLKFGSDHYLSKLLECQVKVIKSGLLDRFQDREIGDYFRVSKATINRIRHGITWKRVEGVVL